MIALPFTRDEFLAVFGEYNVAIGPYMPWLFSACVAVVVGVLLLERDDDRVARTRLAFGVLALLWAWAAVAYHWSFFRAINPAARLFALAFAAQALAFAMLATRRAPRFELGAADGSRNWLGGAIVAYALVGYPPTAATLGHRWPLMPTFGAPCPVVILTLGVMCWAVPRAGWLVLAIPLAWAAIATSAALQLGMWEDLGLTAAAIGAIALELRARRRPPAQLAESLAA